MSVRIFDSIEEIKKFNKSISDLTTIIKEYNNGDFNAEKCLIKIKKVNLQIGEKMNKEKIRDILYSFIDFHTTREIDRLALRVLADRFLEEEIND